MTLTTRLLLFFLGSLAIVLVGFSTALYLLADSYLRGQVNARLDGALDTLVAAAEVRPEGVEWEPHERQLSLTQAAADERVAWAVHDDHNQPLPTSPILIAPAFLASASSEIQSGLDGRETIVYEGRKWLVGQRRVEAQLIDATHPPSPADGNEVLYPALVITAAVPLSPMQAKLSALGWILGGMSLGLWTVAAFVGRVICRRAIAPVGRLAKAASSISASSLDQRLPWPGTKDEMDEFVQAFNGLLARLQDSFERQRRFSGDASHQLRTPLTAMLGQVEVALRHERSVAEYQAVLDRVLAQAVDMRQIVESLLFLARADTDANAPLLEPMCLSTFLRAHLKRWSSHPRAGDFRIHTPDADEVEIKGSAPLLAQLVDNLLENACKYSSTGNAITVRLCRKSDCIALTVEDSGRGIAEEDLPHIFEPFYRSTSARQHGIGGVGLGLAVAKRIATVLGGSLEVESALGRGSKFTLRLAPTPEFGTRKDNSAPLVPAREEA